MESSRDSSVWRSLAVTFGGGLALGAVGMKLTREARRGAEPPARTYADPFTGRLDQIEQRISRIERAPAAGGPQQLDPQVLDAIFSAVDARLREHGAQVDLRLTEQEARSRAAAGNADSRIQQLQNEFQGQMAAIRAAVGEELNQFGEAVSTLVAGQVASLVDARAAALEQAIEPRILAAAAFEEQLAPLRARVEFKERELADLRQRLTESERTVLDVIAAIGKACRQAAERAGDGPTAGPEAREAPPLPVVETTPAPEASAAEEAPGDSLPGFAQPQKQSRLWRIPPVSSFLMATVALLLVHYL